MFYKWLVWQKMAFPIDYTIDWHEMSTATYACYWEGRNRGLI